jgi:CheY-like chemotaxis protein
MARVLVVEPQVIIARNIKKSLDGNEVSVVQEPHGAVLFANDWKPDVVILELSLSGHSGMEFLYEFRSYDDWRDIPIIIYSSILLEAEVINSRLWQQMNIAAFLYKPESSLQKMTDAVNEALQK